MHSEAGILDTIYKMKIKLQHKWVARSAGYMNSVLPFLFMLRKTNWTHIVNFLLVTLWIRMLTKKICHSVEEHSPSVFKIPSLIYNTTEILALSLLMELFAHHFLVSRHPSRCGCKGTVHIFKERLYNYFWETTVHVPECSLRHLKKSQNGACIWRMRVS